MTTNEQKCLCRKSDAWRCAVDSHSRELACSCECHRAPTKKIVANDQIKCPVCGERMKINFYADNMECTDCELELSRIVIKAIQSRIDKEKAAAVQEERERICENLSSRRKHFMECISVNSDTTAHQEPLGHINELAFLIQWLKVQIITGATI